MKLPQQTQAAAWGEGRVTLESLASQTSPNDPLYPLGKISSYVHIFPFRHSETRAYERACYRGNVLPGDGASVPTRLAAEPESRLRPASGEGETGGPAASGYSRFNSPLSGRARPTPEPSIPGRNGPIISHSPCPGLPK
jgi:hypothetical protein